MARPVRSGSIRSSARGAVLGVAGAIAVFFVAAALVWPLWYLATEHTTLYTVLMMLSLAAVAVYMFVARLSCRKTDDR